MLRMIMSLCTPILMHGILSLQGEAYCVAMIFLIGPIQQALFQFAKEHGLKVISFPHTRFWYPD